jgi:shikimate kinase
VTAGPALILVGVPGAGKTTIGQAVAHQAGLAFADTDDDVAATAGQPLQTVVVESGEDAFRRAERDAVLSRLTDFTGVLAVGGGAVASDEVRGALRGRPVVWLRVTAPNAASRMGLNAIRPVALGNIRAQFAAQLKEREQFYAQVAQHTVYTDHRPIAEVVEAVAALLPEDTSAATRGEEQ